MIILNRRMDGKRLEVFGLNADNWLPVHIRLRIPLMPQVILVDSADKRYEFFRHRKSGKGANQRPELAASVHLQNGVAEGAVALLIMDR